VAGEPSLIAMTPASTPYDTLDPADICIVSVDGEVVDARQAPTSELPLHTLVYVRRPEVGDCANA
jgi:ribulose-5-phosphate 4-epimerase/fuculose-1-phosphate aldolase